MHFAVLAWRRVDASRSMVEDILPWSMCMWPWLPQACASARWGGSPPIDEKAATKAGYMQRTCVAKCEVCADAAFPVEPLRLFSAT
jgi:hypothetical protein